MPDAGKEAEEKQARVGLNGEVTYTRCGCDVVFGYDAVGEHHRSDCVMHPDNVINALQQQLADAQETIKNQDERNAIYQRLAHEAYGELADVRQERDRYREALTDGAFWLSGYAPVCHSREWIKKRLRAVLTPGVKGETDGE